MAVSLQPFHPFDEPFEAAGGGGVELPSPPVPPGFHDPELLAWVGSSKDATLRKIAEQSAQQIRRILAVKVGEQIVGNDPLASLSPGAAFDREELAPMLEGGELGRTAAPFGSVRIGVGMSPSRQAHFLMSGVSGADAAREGLALVVNKTRVYCGRIVFEQSSDEPARCAGCMKRHRNTLVFRLKRRTAPQADGYEVYSDLIAVWHGGLDGPCITADVMRHGRYDFKNQRDVRRRIERVINLRKRAFAAMERREQEQIKKLGRSSTGLEHMQAILNREIALRNLESMADGS